MKVGPMAIIRALAQRITPEERAHLAREFQAAGKVVLPDPKGDLKRQGASQ